MSVTTPNPTTFDRKKVGVPFAPIEPGTPIIDPIPKAGELLVLDPQSIVPDRTPFDLTLYVGGAGPDYGDAQITQYMADAGQIGQTQIDFKIPNRTITIPLVMQDRGVGLSFEQVRADLQKKVGLLQWQGGWLRRATTVGNVYAEIVGAQLKFGGSSAQAQYQVDPDATLTLITLPEWLGEEVSVLSQSLQGYASVTMTGVHGDFPGRTRIIVHETASNDQRGLIWGTRSHYYVPDTTAKTHYEAEDLTPVGGSTVVGLSGASGGSAVKFSNIPSSAGNAYTPKWFPVVSTALQVGGDMTHIGSYRVWARCYATGSGTIPSVSVRLSWDVGDLIVGTSNAAAAIPNKDASGNPLNGYNGFYMLDLGQIRLDKAPIGSHRWEGTFEVMSLDPGPAGLESIFIDEVFIVPVDEGYGTLTSGGPGDAVIYAGAAMELRTDGAYRLATAGNNSYGPVSHVIGDLPRLPVSGLEGRTVELFVKPTQSNLSTIPDASIDTFDLLVLYRPSYLFVSEA